MIRGNGRGCLGFSPEEGALRQWPSQGLEPGVQYCGSQWIINWTLYITMSDLLDNSIIKGLWHVPQKLLLLDRLDVGALHLENFPFSSFFQFLTIPWLTFRILATGSNTWKVFVDIILLGTGSQYYQISLPASENILMWLTPRFLIMAAMTIPVLPLPPAQCTRQFRP